MVRRMLFNAGHGVITLQRVRYGALRLGNLPEGSIRSISEEEFSWFKAWAVEHDIANMAAMTERYQKEKLTIDRKNKRRKKD